MRRKWFTVETSYSDWVSSERISVVRACLEGAGEESWCGCAPCGPSQPARGGGFLSPSPALTESHPETETLDINGVRSSMRVADTDTARGSNYTPFISGLTTSEVKARTGSLNQTLYIPEKIANGLYKRKPFSLHAGLNFWTGHRLLLHVKGPLFSATRTLSAETPAKARGWIEDTRSSPALQSFRACWGLLLLSGLKLAETPRARQFYKNPPNTPFQI